MNEHTKKMIAPIVVTLLVVLYYGGIAMVFLMVDGISLLAKLSLIAVPLAVAGVMIGVLYTRIKEIRSGEEDDLSEY